MIKNSEVHSQSFQTSPSDYKLQNESQQLSTQQSRTTRACLVNLLFLAFIIVSGISLLFYESYINRTPTYCLGDPLTKQCDRPMNGSRQMYMKTRYGFYMYGDPRQQSVSYHICLYGTWQPHHISMMGRFVKPGDTVLNLGSQTGLESLVFAKIIGDTGKMYIFEPYSVSNNLVTKSYKKNGWSKFTTIYKIAVSDTQRKSTLTIAQQNTGASSLVNRTKYDKLAISKTNVTYQQVDVKPVDNVLPADAVIDFALIDVEMHITEALMGMRKTIERSPNLVMFVEWDYLINVERDEAKTKQILNFLIKKGYKFYSVNGFDPYQCKMGQFIEKKDPLKEMMKITFEDVLLVPSTVTLPS